MGRKSFHLNPAGEKAFGYAQAVRRGDYLHISGTLSVDEDFTPLHAGDMEAQLQRVYDTLRRTLCAFDMDFPNVVSERIYVTDMDAFLAANAARLARYKGCDLPAATAVEVRRLAFPECMVEVEIVAAR
ncbi:RidA family protein [Sphingosinicella rhizophila]|uniref:RidA family protein n=1 Tax=Sphingosinicella rhizophila TaxID=3050082 RepID=A0ABU3Q6W7_9SPHN|nr:RidA family protein [Sphingosinicella sp. GR2756]MDT9599144.1 RidA family protein [Sphingosinicella sp. GR2756]